MRKLSITAAALLGAATLAVPAPAQLGTTTSFGAGCPGTAGVPKVAETGMPTSGQPFTLRAANVPGPWVVVLGIGPLTIPLPGAPGCNLLVSPDLVVPGTGSSLTFAIPATAAGATFYDQIAAADPAANPLGITTSNGLRHDVGPGRPAPVITSVFPTSGGDGTTITILGSGFDPNPVANCVAVGGPEGPTVRVVSVDPTGTRLVGVVRAFSAPVVGPVMVAVGEGQWTQSSFTAGGGTSHGTSIDFGAITGAVGSGAIFQAGPPSPVTVKAQPGVGGVVFDFARQGAWQSPNVTVDVHINYCDVTADITLPPGLTRAACLAHIANYINGKRDLSASVSGDTIAVVKLDSQGDPVPVTSAKGYVKNG